VIAAKAVNFLEDLQPSFGQYIDQVLLNTKACNDELLRRGAKVSGTENHLFLLNVLASFGLNGLDAQKRLEACGITTNKNMIHGDTLKPAFTSGLRIGFAAATSRGCTKEDAIQIADLIFDILSSQETDLTPYQKAVGAITSRWADVMSLSY
jgi:glycine hydroxymethyltransferase